MRFDPQDAFEIRFFENLARRDRKNVQALELLGGLYSKYGMAKQALRIDRRLVRLLPQDPRARYNFACSLALLDRKREAVDALAEAIELGYRDWDWLRQDPDLEPLKGYRRFEDLIEAASDGD